MIQRLTDRPLPPYRFLPGGNLPHPAEHPDGYLRGLDVPVEPLLPPERWAEQTDYLFGIDLFNLDYHWQAHEAWEGLWRQAAGDQRLWLHGLIQLAAMMLKRQTGHARGAAILRERALAKLQPIADRHPRFMGLSPRELIAAARTDQPIVLMPAAV